MSIIGWIILGLVSSFIASKLVNHRGEGLILDIVLGIVGDCRRVVIFVLWRCRSDGLQSLQYVVAVIGAVVVLVIYHAVVDRGATI